MIASLRGIVSEKLNNLLVLDVGGIGYGLYVTHEEMGRMPIGTETKLYVFENIKEDTYHLYGFATLHAKDLFELLLSVNGVGPKMALSIMNIGTESRVKQAIATGDLKYIQAAQGVGKRVAERVVVDLKDKVGPPSSADAVDFLFAPSANTNDEAFQALLALGYTAQDAAKALETIDSQLATEDRIRMALKSR